MMLYLQIQIGLIAGLVLYYLLPRTFIAFRSQKLLAQIVFAMSIAVPAIMFTLPDSVFSQPENQLEVVSAKDVDGAPAMNAVVQREIRRAIVVVAGSPTRQARGYLDLIMIGLGLGSLIVLIFKMTRWWNLFHLLNQATDLHRIGRVAVVVSDRVEIPFSVWTLNTAFVVIPASLISHLQDFRIALRHEIEHHRRRDTVWAVGFELLTVLFFLNPAIYLWRNTILKLQELACDEALISRMRISPHAYGSCLLRVAEAALRGRIMYGGTTCMIPSSKINNGRSFLKRRIYMFFQHSQRRTRRGVVGVLSVLAGGVLIGAVYAAQAAIRAGGPNPGQPVFDEAIQKLTTESLAQGLVSVRAPAGFAIVSDAKTGTVLAAVNINNGFDPKLKGNWALSYPMQPASALKAVIAAAALELKMTTMDEKHDCEHGEYDFAGMNIRDIKPFDKLTTADTVAQSSNICSIKIAQKLQAAGLANALREFGLGRGGTARDFPGAASGNLPPAGVIDNDKYLALLAQGVSNRTGFYVTPLEMVQAFGAMANGGHLMRARAINSTSPVEQDRQVVSADVSSQMRQILRKVVTEGTAPKLINSKIQLAGKTSTHDHTAPAGRVGGFIGFAPANDPKLVIYVAVFDAAIPNAYGSTTAAPIFKDIAEKVIPKY